MVGGFLWHRKAPLTRLDQVISYLETFLFAKCCQPGRRHGFVSFRGTDWVASLRMTSYVKSKLQVVFLKEFLKWFLHR